MADGSGDVSRFSRRLPFKFHIGCITVIGYTYINALIPHDITHSI